MDILSKPLASKLGGDILENNGFRRDAGDTSGSRDFTGTGTSGTGIFAVPYTVKIGSKHPNGDIRISSKLTSGQLGSSVINGRTGKVFAGITVFCMAASVIAISSRRVGITGTFLTQGSVTTTLLTFWPCLT